MSVSSTVYQALFKRTSTFTLVVVAGVFVFEPAVDVASQSIFNSINEGKLWQQIKHKYVN